MNTTEDLKKYVATLVETNRALANDLDASRRVIASIGRERDALRHEISQIRSESERVASAGALSEWREDVERLMRTLADERAALEQLRQTQAQLLRDAKHDQAELRRAESEIDALTVALNRVEQERDTARLELDEATSAMAEIHRCLKGSLLETWSAGVSEPPLYG